MTHFERKKGGGVRHFSKLMVLMKTDQKPPGGPINSERGAHCSKVPIPRVPSAPPHKLVIRTNPDDIRKSGNFVVVPQALTSVASRTVRIIHFRKNRNFP